MNYKGIIIAESLKGQLPSGIAIKNQRIEPVTEKHKTPWLEQWTLLEVEIPEDKTEDIAVELSMFIDSEHASSWYIDFKNDKLHYVIYRAKIFKIDRQDPDGYKEAKEYGLALGIPEHQLDFEK